MADMGRVYIITGRLIILRMSSHGNSVSATRSFHLLPVACMRSLTLPPPQYSMTIQRASSCR